MECGVLETLPRQGDRTQRTTNGNIRYTANRKFLDSTDGHSRKWRPCRHRRHFLSIHVLRGMPAMLPHLCGGAFPLSCDSNPVQIDRWGKAAFPLGRVKSRHALFKNNGFVCEIQASGHATTPRQPEEKRGYREESRCEPLHYHSALTSIHRPASSFPSLAEDTPRRLSCGHLLPQDAEPQRCSHEKPWQYKKRVLRYFGNYKCLGRKSR